MITHKSLKIALSALALGLSGQVSAAIITDTVQAPTAFFVPTDAQKYDSPYYRWAAEDWGWVHNPIAGTIGSATLSISAFDVDANSSTPEVDNISAYNSNTASWDILGSLSGSNNTWAFTTFNLGASWFDEIAAGLQVRIDIDSTNTGGWAVALAKSSLSIDGGVLPPPAPTVPVPAAVWLFGSGLLGLIGLGRKRKTF